ncbi:unnamed protein product, partial [Notodromas monacha]
MLQEKELKRQQALVIQEQERERRRQHMALLRSLDARKRWEERERRRNEVKLEKEAVKDRKLDRRRIEVELMKELRRAVEDLEINDLDDLPDVKRIPCLRLPGAAFANILMVFEFLHQFGETLGFGKIYLTANANGEVKSAMGVPLDRKDVLVEKTEAFIQRLSQNAIFKLSVQLREKPFLSLNPTDKSAIVAFICHELLQNKAVVRYIEDSIENLNAVRKDKWLTDGHLRKLKMVYQRKYKGSLKRLSSGLHVANHPEDSNMSTVSGTSEGTKENEENEEEEEEESGNESDQTEDFGSDAALQMLAESMSKEDVEKKMESLILDSEERRYALWDALCRLRGQHIGQD